MISHILKLSKIRGRKGEGDLKEEMPGIILAVIGLLLVGFVAYKIYDATKSQEEKSARTLADSIEAKIKAISDGESGKITIQGFPVKDGKPWRIAGWGKDETTIPDKCFPESCICICKFSVAEMGLARDKTALQTTCQENGYCRKFGDMKIFIYADETYYEAISGDESGVPSQKVSVTYNSIKIRSELLELNVDKTEDVIEVNYYYESPDPL